MAPVRPGLDQLECRVTSRVFRLRTFGGLALESPGAVLPVAAARRRSLALIALAAPNKSGISVEQALSLLWPEQDSSNARNNLKQLVFALRHALGPDIFERDASVIRLNESRFQADLWEFEQHLADAALENAAALYSGPFLQGFYLPGLPEFERWVDAKRSELATKYADAVRALALWAATDGRYEQEVHWFRILVSQDPLNDTYAMGLVRALASAGDIAAAMKHARTHTALMKHELDVEPAPEFRRAVEQLRQGLPMPKRVPTLLSLRPPTPTAPMPAFVAASSGVASPTASAAAPTVEHALAARADSAIAIHRHAAADSPFQPAPSRGPAVAPKRGVSVPYLSGVIVTILSAALVALPGMWIISRPARATSAAHGTSMVVLPFVVNGDGENTDISATVVELLATSLDGSLGLRVIPAIGAGTPGSRDVTRRETYADVQNNASRIAAKLSASVYVTGEIVQSGTRVRISAEVRDRNARAPTMNRAVVEGDRTQLLSLVDGVAAQILAGRFDGARGEEARVASITTSSLAAAKAYFSAEEAYRAGRFRAAVDGYREAIRVDSGFALAHYALSGAAEMLGDDDLVRRAAGDALRHASRLPSRQKRLLLAYLTRQRGDVDQAEQLYSQITADYPGDAGAWMGLGETLFHLNPLRGRRATDAREAFERVLVLDPTNTSARVHLARIASLLGHDDGARRNVELARRLAPDDVIGRYALHVLSLGGPNLEAGVARERLERAAAELPGPTAIDLLTGSASDALDRFAGQFTQREVASDVRAYGFRLLALAAAGRGQIGAAMSLLASCPETDHSSTIEARSRLAALDFVPMDAKQLERVREEVRGWTPEAHVADDLIDSLAHASAHPVLRLHRIGLLSLRLGDTAAVLDMARQIDSTRPAGHGPAIGPTLAASLRARVAAARGQTREALTMIERAGWNRAAGTTPLEAYDRLFRAQLLERLGRYDEAVEFYAQIGSRSPYELPYLWPAELGMARIAERKGDRAGALRWYGSVAERLRGAEPSLQVEAELAAKHAEALR